MRRSAATSDRGNGREYGVEGLEEYLETKAILGYGTARPRHEHPRSEGTPLMTVALLLHRADGAALSTPFRKATLGPTDPLRACARSPGKGRAR